MSKVFLWGKIAAFVVVGACAVVLYGKYKIQKSDLMAARTRAEQAEERSVALEAAQTFRTAQISALQTLAQGCEESRVQVAADAEARRAILEPVTGRAGSGKIPDVKASQGGIASPPQHFPKKDRAHESTRRAVAARLNRPL